MSCARMTLRSRCGQHPFIVASTLKGRRRVIAMLAMFEKTLPAAPIGDFSQFFGAKSQPTTCKSN